MPEITEYYPGAWSVLHDNRTYKQPAVRFPGDDEITLGEYADCMDKIYAGTMARSFCAQAEGFGIAITPERYERIKRMLGLSCLCDEWLDNTPDTQTSIKRSIEFNRLWSDQSTGMVEGEPRLTIAFKLWDAASQNLRADELNTIRQLMRSFGALTRARSAAASLPSYQFLTYGEGQRAGMVWAATLCAGTPEVDGRIADTFSRWLGEVAAVATLIDAGLDLTDDYRSGRVQFKPTPLARLQLCLSGVSALQGVFSKEAKEARRRQPLKGFGFLRELLS